MRTFLGSMGYYRQFVPNFGKWSSALTPAAALNAPKVVPWTEDMEAAFENLKVSLCASVVLNCHVQAMSFCCIQTHQAGDWEHVYMCCVMGRSNQ